MSAASRSARVRLHAVLFSDAIVHSPRFFFFGCIGVVGEAAILFVCSVSSSIACSTADAVRERVLYFVCANVDESI